MLEITSWTLQVSVCCTSGWFVPLLSTDSSTPDVSLKPRVSEASELQAQQHNGAPYLPLSRTPFPAVTVDQSISTYSGTTHWQDAEIHDILFPFNLNLFTSHRKPNNSSLCYIGQPPRLLRLLRHVTAVLIPESIMDVLSTWTRRPAAAMERRTCETLFSSIIMFFLSTQWAVNTLWKVSVCVKHFPHFFLQNSRHLETICWSRPPVTLSGNGQ